MFENIGHFFKRIVKTEQQKELGSKDAAKERLHLVLMQDRANVSADFLELMKQEIIDVIKKYIEIDEKEIDVRLTNKENEDGTNGAPALYANIPILNIRNDTRKMNKNDNTVENDKKEKNSNQEINREKKEDNKIEENKETENKEENKNNNIKEEEKIKEEKTSDDEEEKKKNNNNIEDLEDNKEKQKVKSEK